MFTRLHSSTYWLAWPIYCVCLPSLPYLCSLVCTSLFIFVLTFSLVHIFRHFLTYIHLVFMFPRLQSSTFWLIWSTVRVFLHSLTFIYLDICFHALIHLCIDKIIRQWEFCVAFFPTFTWFSCLQVLSSYWLISSAVRVFSHLHSPVCAFFIHIDRIVWRCESSVTFLPSFTWLSCLHFFIHLVIDWLVRRACG